MDDEYPDNRVSFLDFGDIDSFDKNAEKPDRTITAYYAWLCIPDDVQVELSNYVRSPPPKPHLYSMHI
jgi:hypothetical protein